MHTKTEYTNKECLHVWLNLESNHTCLVASDFFVKPEGLLHIPRTWFVNSCQMYKLALYLALKNFIVVRKVKLYLLPVTLWEYYFTLRFLILVFKT